MHIKKELLFSVTSKDLRVEFFSGTGAGGQYRNKHQNCVRLHHLDSGAMVTGQSNRNRKANINEALNNLVNSPKFKLWSSRKVQEVITGKSIESIVDSMMIPENPRIEVKENGKWIENNNMLG